MEPGSLNLLGGATWLFPGPTNIGIYDTGDGVILIDSGNDKDAGRKVLRLIESKGWKLRSIVNTHSNADHIGANSYLKNAAGCEIMAPAGETPFIEYPLLENSFLWGGFPFRELRSKFFEAKPSHVDRAFPAELAEGALKFIPLPGHFFDMHGVLTSDGVFFMADSIFGERILEKYKVPFIYDVEAFKSSLAKLKTIEASWYVPSHGEPCSSIDELADINLKRVEEMEAAIMSRLRAPGTFEDCLASLCSSFGITLDHGQYVLVGSTLRSFLSYLHDQGRLDYSFGDGRMLWQEARHEA